MTWNFLLMPSYGIVFCRKLRFYLFLLDCKLQFYFSQCFCFLRVSMSFLQGYYFLNINYGNVLLHFGWEEFKNHKNIFFFPTNPPQICNKIDPHKQLRSIFHKIVNRNKLKVRTFQSCRLSYQFFRNKENCNWSGGRGGGFFNPIIFSVCTHKFPI